MAIVNQQCEIGAADRQRTYRSIMAIGGVGALFLGVFGINALVSESLPLGGALVALSLVVVLLMYLVKRSGRMAYGTDGMSLIVVITFTLLLATGGVANTGPLWCYPLMLIVVLLQGFRRGFGAVAGLLAIALLLLYVPGFPGVTADYENAFKLRFISSFTALAILGLIYEYLRWSMHSDVVAIGQALDRASRTDALTGLVNRRDMLERLEAELSGYHRLGHQFAVIMVDIDHFKRINDSFGHASGDRLLMMFARHLVAGTRNSDVVARWGGEEFLVLLPHTDVAQAGLVAHKMHASPLRVHLASQGKDIEVKASFGVASVSERSDVRGLISLADERLYAAKWQGRDRVVGGD